MISERKRKKIYKRKVMPILDKAVQDAQKIAPYLLSFKNAKTNFAEYTEIEEGPAIQELCKIRHHFMKERHKIIKKYPFINVDENFFTKMVTHFKTEYVLKNLYEINTTNIVIQDLIKQVIARKKSNSEYFNLNEIVNEILIEINNSTHHVESNL
jgi:hypothetical protein